MKDEEHGIKGALLWVFLSWIVFALGVYLTYSGTSLHSIAGGASTFESIASVAYLAALLITIHYNCKKVFHGHLSLWVSLAFGAAGYVIEQSVYLNANDPEKSEGGIIFALALIVALVAALICSVSVLGNRLLDAYGTKGPQRKDRI